MEKFQCINWSLPLENLIDDVFINNERMERDSAMHKLLNGNFVDPFCDIEEDFTDPNMKKRLKFYANDIWKQCGNLESNNSEGKQQQKKQQRKRKLKTTTNEQEIVENKDSYVPDTREPLEFCEQSTSNVIEQTPTQKSSRKMPAMVKSYQGEIFKSSNAILETPEVKKHIEKNKNISEQTVPVRRSLREKKPTRKLAEK